MPGPGGNRISPRPARAESPPTAVVPGLKLGQALHGMVWYLAGTEKTGKMEVPRGSMASPEINPNIFRQYDLRGMVDRDLTPEALEAIGRSFGSTIQVNSPGSRRKMITVGHDVRVSSADFRTAFARGVNAAGVDVVDVGMVATPILYYSIFHWDADGGAMITGSHNPVAYNGIKICEGKWPIYGDAIIALRDRIQAGRFTSGQGTVEKRDVLSPYIAQLKEKFPHRYDARVVVDAGNGAAGPIMPGILKDLGCTVDCLYCEPDGNFPNHLPDPEVSSNVHDLIQRLRETKADLGLAFDGDADRVGVIDERGRKITSDRILLLFAKHYLKQFGGGKVVYDVKCSDILESQIQEAGGIPVMWKTGHSLIKKKMREEEALLAGELSGHICIYKNYYGFDDAFFAALLVLEICRQSGMSLGSLLDAFPRTYSTDEVKVGCPDDVKFQLVEDLQSKARHMGERVIDIDGVRIIYPEGWILVRASNTTPILTVRFESHSPEGLHQLAGRTSKLLSEYPILDLSGLKQAVNNL